MLHSNFNNSVSMSYPLSFQIGSDTEIKEKNMEGRFSASNLAGDPRRGRISIGSDHAYVHQCVGMGIRDTWEVILGMAA
jgi:hypothetical protein